MDELINWRLVPEDFTGVINNRKVVLLHLACGKRYIANDMQTVMLRLLNHQCAIRTG